MKFLNKKEDVINFKLTSYGKYLLSIGEFEPEFYAFFDDNVLYDSRYGGLTDRFADGKVIELISDGLMIYLEEQNTILLNDNFDIEVFEVVSGALNPLCESCTSGPESQKRDKYERLFFENEHDRLGGAPITDEYINYMNTKIQRSYDKTSTQASSSVSYYFDIVKDELVNRQTACAGVEVFNKQSLYVNLDFDCDDITDNVPNAGFVDIYGKVTEPEPCQ
jgi:hypothetical protein